MTNNQATKKKFNHYRITIEQIENASTKQQLSIDFEDREDILEFHPG